MITCQYRILSYGTSGHPACSFITLSHNHFQIQSQQGEFSKFFQGECPQIPQQEFIECALCTLCKLVQYCKKPHLNFCCYSNSKYERLNLKSKPASDPPLFISGSVPENITYFVVHDDLPIYHLMRLITILATAVLTNHSPRTCI